MNKGKFILIILSIVFAVADVAWSVYECVNYFMIDPAFRQPIFYLIYEFIIIAVEIAVIVMLIICIWGNGKHFRSHYGLYMTALVASVIINLTSVATVLLVVTMFIPDWSWIKNADESVYHKEEKIHNQQEDVIIIPNREEMIASLREKKEKGEISEEQFQEELMKLL